MRSKELVICGLKAVRSRFETNSDSVKRLFFNHAVAPAVGDICHWMAEERLVYRCVESEELELISGTIHHGGIAVVVEAPVLPNPTDDDIRTWAKRGEPLLLLDRISNVHNLGALIRTAAYFGIPRLILPDHPQAALPSEATYRVAEGGLDHVEVFRVSSLVNFIHGIRPYFDVYGAATRGGVPALSGGNRRPAALVVGNEETGLDEDVASACNVLVTVPGSGHIESLNVSAAAAVLMWEIVRQRAIPQSRPSNHRDSFQRSSGPPRR